MTSELRVAVLQTGRAIPEALAEHGDYDMMCKRVIGYGPDEADTFAVLDGHFPESFEDYDVLVITGSKHGVYEGHPWIAPLENTIRSAMDAGKRMIGICFGHQIMAQALGGKAVKSDKGLGVGLMDYRFVNADRSETPMRLYAWHSDQVVEAPPGAQVIASSDFCPIAGLRYGDQAITVQPHPEFTKGYMEALISTRRGTAVLAEDLAVKAQASLAQPAHTADAEQMLQDFISQPTLQAISA